MNMKKIGLLMYATGTILILSLMIFVVYVNQNKELSFSVGNTDNRTPLQQYIAHYIYNNTIMSFLMRNLSFSISSPGPNASINPNDNFKWVYNMVSFPNLLNYPNSSTVLIVMAFCFNNTIFENNPIFTQINATIGPIQHISNWNMTITNSFDTGLVGETWVHNINQTRIDTNAFQEVHYITNMVFDYSFTLPQSDFDFLLRF